MTQIVAHNADMASVTIDRKFPLVIADPPYGGIVADKWDQDVSSMNMLLWARKCSEMMLQGAWVSK